MVELIKEAKLSVRLNWALVITGAVLLTIVGLLLLHHDVANEEKATPESVYQPPVATNVPEVAPAYSGKRLDLNLATKGELMNLPGVGDTLAQRIIDYRTESPFKVVRDLKKVSGIGEKTFASICDYVYVTLPEDGR